MPIQRLSTPDAIAKVAAEPDLVHLDVRSVPEFEAGHAPNAYNIPLMHMGPAGMVPNPEFAAEVQAHFGKDTPIMVSCKAGGRSARAAAVLEGLGYTRLSDQVGGWSGGNGDGGWVAGGGPAGTATLPGHDHASLKR
ncbi:rhodanese-like domain-containing protein [Nannocystis sp. SCPEA4]|uniref:rhodanese-like domain-containing protein n=1 Tax=Nannocystis sp. SCPEA4 TaxID=2996787 RepID=UPI00226FAC12|nr:rhodanese-like domain-containing protein [Nannocystis sp. SCPEA4]MCY1054464.1 rhodanese-like domain-containing protein [Nannocystis sp. SCPEA4]